MARHSNREHQGHKNPRRVAAGKRAYKKTGLYRHNQKAKKFGRKKSGGGRKKTSFASKKKSHRRKHSFGFVGQKQRHRASQAAGVARAAAHAQRKAAGAASRQMYAAAKASYVGRGYTPKQAAHAAKRYVRMLKFAASRAQAVGAANSVADAYSSSARSYGAGFAAYKGRH